MNFNRLLISIGPNRYVSPSADRSFRFSQHIVLPRVGRLATRLEPLLLPHPIPRTEGIAITRQNRLKNFFFFFRNEKNHRISQPPTIIQISTSPSSIRARKNSGSEWRKMDERANKPGAGR